MFGFKGLHHIAISVPSMAEAKEFYVGKLGFELVSDNELGASEKGDKVTELKGAACSMIMVKAGNLFLEIFEFHSPTPAEQDRRPVCDHGYTHLAFEVDDIQAAYDYLGEAGMKWHHSPVEMAEGYLMTYGRDPFGNVIEIQQLVGGLPFSFDQLSLPYQ